MRTKLVILLLAAVFFLSNTAFATGETSSKTEQLNSLFTTADLMDATVSELLAAMEDGRLTSQRLVQMYIDRIEAYDNQLNSIISINPNVYDEAKQADTLRSSGKPLGRLHGIPVIVKDNIDVVGMATTCGDVSRRNAVAAEDAEVVKRLKAEGAVILAKANMSEYAYYGCNSISSIGGTVHNAYDLSRTPAGSSGGTAVAITCNFAAVGLGTDTGSSIRRPASFANIVGLRPSFGLVSQSGLYRLNWDQDTIGPMCRSTEDTALILDIMAGTDEADAYSAEADSYLPAEGYTVSLSADGLRGKRIGYLANSFGYLYSTYSSEALSNPEPLHERVQPMVDRSLDLLEAGGAELIDLSEILTETQISTLRYENSRTAMLHFRQVVTELLSEHEIDAVIYISQTDIAETEAKCWDEETNNAASYINAFGPLAGLPEIMVPMGFCVTGTDCEYPLPLGMSLFAGYGNDMALLEIAYAFEQLADTRQQPALTPALPDKNLEAFAQTLLLEASNIQDGIYAEESMERLTAAKQQLLSLSMEDDVALYQEATAALAVALDSMSIPIPIVSEHAAPPAGGRQKGPAPSENKLSWTQLLLGSVTVGSIVFIEVYDYTRKRKQRKKTPIPK